MFSNAKGWLDIEVSSRTARISVGAVPGGISGFWPLILDALASLQLREQCRFVSSECFKKLTIP